MAIKLASLFIELAVNGDKLTAELKNSTNRTKKWSKDVAKAADVAKRAFSAVTVGAGLATAGLTAMYVSSSKTLDSLGKTAAKLGDTTQDLRAFGVAAEYGGVGADAANVALQRMTRRLSEAAQGTGEAKGAINQLGLDAARLATLRPSQAFEEIAAELEKIPAASDRVRLAMKFFDSEGVALVNVTRDVLQKARDDVDALGGALTNIQIAQIEAANDAVFRLRTGFSLVSERITFKLSPAVLAVSNALFDAASQGTQLDAVLDKAVDSGVNGFARLLNATGRAVSFIDGRPEIASAGVIGYLLGGKLGFLAFSAASAGFDTISATYDAIKSKFDLTLSDADRAEIDLRRIVSKMELLSVPGIGSIFGLGNRDGQLAELEQQRREVVTILSDMGEFDRITATLFNDSESALSTLGQSLIDVSESIKSASSESRILLDRPAPPNIDLLPTLMTPAANDPKKEKVKTPEELAIERRENYFSEQLAAEKRFQDTWTLFEETGSKNRAKIMLMETSGALGILAQHSRKLFELNKAVGLANATIYIAEGVSAALRLPFPANLAAAATVALNGAAQIKTITSSEYGKGTVTPVGDGAAPVTDVASPNTTTAANDAAIADGINNNTGGTALFLFTSPGATEEQIADQQAQMFQIAQDNDLLVPNGKGGFTYTGSGGSSYVRPNYEQVA